MNIFMLDLCPRQTAMWHVDSHVVKMPLEAAQLLSSTHRVLGTSFSNEVYRKTHVNHPSCVWVRSKRENYDWTYEYYRALSEEYTYRYDRVHASWTKLSIVLSNNPVSKFENEIEGLSTLPCCMPDIYKVSDNSITNYRQYYRLGKASLHVWTKRSQPEWIW